MDTLFPKKRKLTLRTEASEAEKKRLAEEEAAKKAEEAKALAESNQEEGDTNAEAGQEAAPEGEANKEASEEKAETEAKTDNKDSKKKSKKKGEPSSEREKLEVTRMLALAEGRANDPSGKSPREKQAAVAFIGLRHLTVFFIFSVFAMGFIERDLIMTANAIMMAKSPYLLIAAFDLIVVVILLLQVTEVYPLIRFRAAIGTGLLSMLFYSSGDYILILANLLMMIAIYFCSAIIKIRSLIVFGSIGIAGVLGYLYVLFLR